MKKHIKTTIIVLIIIFVIFSIYKLFIKEFKTEYVIDKYKVKEHFYVEGNHYYDILIKNKKNVYIYTLKNNLSKNKKIIKSIKTYKSHNLTCIVPIYKKKIDINIYCNLDNKQVSNYYLQSINNQDFKEIMKKVKKYKISLPKEKDTKTHYKKLIIYKDNIDNNIYYLWDYKGIYIIKKDKISYKKILNHDLYDNIMATTINKDYVLFDNYSVNGIKSIYYYNSKKDKVKEIKVQEKISKDSYINGVIDNLIYFTDKRNKKEYTLNIKKEKIEEIDNDQTTYIIYNNGERKELTKSDFFMKNHMFNNNNIVDNKVTTSKELKKNKKYYYFIENDKVSKSIETSKENKILLFELDHIKDWYLSSDNELFILRNDTLYSYKDSTGLRKILRSNELRYNYKNIYKIGK